MQIPSGPTPSAQTRRLESVPSSAMSNAVSLRANDSAMISVELSGVTTMPFGNAMSSATAARGSVRGDERDDPGAHVPSSGWKSVPPLT